MALSRAHRTAQALAAMVLAVGSTASAQVLTPPNVSALGTQQWAYNPDHSQVLSGGHDVNAVRLVASALSTSITQNGMRMRLESPGGAVLLIGGGAAISWYEPGVFLTGTPPQSLVSAQQIDATYAFDFGGIDGEWKVNFLNHWSHGFLTWNNIQVIPLQLGVGACCLPDGGCEEIIEVQCTNAGGVFYGDNSECATIPPCPQPGACCLSTGGCMLTNSAQCAAAGGTFHGAGTVCATICPPPTDMLLPPNAHPEGKRWAYTNHYSQVLSGGQDIRAVRLVASADLAPGATWQTDMQMRLESPSGAVLLIGSGGDISWHDLGVMLSGTPPLHTGHPGEIDVTYAFNFGNIDGVWKVNFFNDWTSGPLRWNNIEVIPVALPVGACCLPNGGCEEIIEALCTIAEGVFYGDNSQCATTPPCPQPGACCLPTGGCELTTSALCAAAGGAFSGIGTECATSCLPPLLPPNAHPQGNQWAYPVDHSQVLAGGQYINAVRLVATANAAPGGEWQSDMRMRLESPSGAVLLIGSGAGLSWNEPGVMLSGTPPWDTGDPGQIDVTYLFDFGIIDGLWKVNFFNDYPTGPLRWNDIVVIPIALPVGACCLPHGGCEEIIEVECADAGGVFSGGHSECATIPPCPPPPIEIIVPSAQANSPGGTQSGIPFGTHINSQRYQQVHGATDFGLLSGPHELREIRFRPNNTSTFVGPWSNQFTLELSFSTTQLGPDMLTTVFEDNHGADRLIAYSGEATISTAQSGPSPTPLDFDIVIELQTPFTYDPALGHLLMDITRIGYTLPPPGLFFDAHNEVGDAVQMVWANDANLPTGMFGWPPSLGLITKFVFEAGTDVCYANCDKSTVEPILNVDDFTCFINEFAAAQSLPHEEQITHYANCDGSTIAPVLNVDDFTCFINSFAQGCP